MNTENKEFLSLGEVAKYLGVHITTIYRYLKDGGKPLPSMRLSKKKILIKQTDLKDWLSSK